MQINPVIEAIYAAFKLEIGNQFFLTNNSIVVTFPDQSRAVISAPQVAPSPDSLNLVTPDIPPLNSTHTYHYLHQHDFNQQSESLLNLQNLEDCRAYLDDVCQNLLSVPVHDFEITFPDGTIYLLTIETIE